MGKSGGRFSDIVEGIRDICQKLIAKQFVSNTSISFANLPEKLRFDQVFLKSGTPNYTFVEYADFKRLKFAIAKPGRGVVIEGPSGIGKTTAVKKAIEDIVLKSQTPSLPVQVLSARNRSSSNKSRPCKMGIMELSLLMIFIDSMKHCDNMWLITLKYLADTEPELKKVSDCRYTLYTSKSGRIIL